MMLVALSVTEFRRELGSSSPAPGGGSVAALSGALAADLVSMVCRLSIGRKDLQDHHETLESTLKEAQTLADDLAARVDSDANAFNDVMAAFRLPKENEEQIAERRQKIQDGYKSAADSPLAIAGGCLQVLKLVDRILNISNPNTLSDLGVAASQAHAGLVGALMNVQINLPSIKDETYLKDTRESAADMSGEGNSLMNGLLESVSA